MTKISSEHDTRDYGKLVDFEYIIVVTSAICHHNQFVIEKFVDARMKV